MNGHISCVISDFGGVLTTPLVESFAAFQDQTGIPVEALGKAMQTISERDGVHPLYELEKGRITEKYFLKEMAAALEPELGHRPEMHRFSQIYFDALQPNTEMLALMTEAKDAGFRMAMLTNNVREWEITWRSMLPVDEIFELVVDSAFVDCRKPEPEIYEITLDRLGLAGDECLFVDDIEPNCIGAREHGIIAVHFVTNEQAIPEIRAALGL